MVLNEDHVENVNATTEIFEHNQSMKRSKQSKCERKTVKVITKKKVSLKSNEDSGTVIEYVELLTFLIYDSIYTF